MKTTKTAETIVIIDCPRCAGQGSRDHWHPDSGICYLCGGKAWLDVNIERGERHLKYLRWQYRQARVNGSPEWLSYLAQKGLMKKELVELAKARKAELDARKGN